MYKGANGTIQYRVSLRDDLINVIIPHFEKYPLITQKWSDYKIFKSIVELMHNKEHVTPEGLNKVLSLKASLNKGLSPALIEAFPLITAVDRPKAPVPEIVDPEWVVGFTEAEGCFMIKISKSSTYKLGVQTQLKFQITQSSRDMLLISKLVSYLGCGTVEVTKEGQVAVFVVTKFTDICEIILPFFDKHSLKGFKSSNYTSFKQGVDIFRKKEHLTASGLSSLIKIKESMNSSGLVLDKEVSSVYAYGSTDKMKSFLDKRCYSTLPINKHTKKLGLYSKNEEVSNTKETTLSLDSSQKKGFVKALYINSIYVYNRDKSILYYFTNNRQQFLHDFNIHYATFEKHFEKGTYYLGRYLFTNYLVPTSKSQMTASEFALKLAKDRQSKHKR